MKSRRFGRLILCLPLIWVMALWVFSFSRHERWERSTSTHRYWALSSDGVLHVEQDDLDADNPGLTALGAPVRSFEAPWWAIWVTMGFLTLSVHFVLVRTRNRN